MIKARMQIYQAKRRKLQNFQRESEEKLVKFRNVGVAIFVKKAMDPHLL